MNAKELIASKIEEGSAPTSLRDYFDTKHVKLVSKIGKELEWDLGDAYAFCVFLLEEVNAHKESAAVDKFLASISPGNANSVRLFYDRTMQPLINEVARVLSYGILEAGAFCVMLLEDVNAHAESRAVDKLLIKMFDRAGLFESKEETTVDNSYDKVDTVVAVEIKKLTDPKYGQYRIHVPNLPSELKNDKKVVALMKTTFKDNSSAIAGAKKVFPKAQASVESHAKALIAAKLNEGRGDPISKDELMDNLIREFERIPGVASADIIDTWWEGRDTLWLNSSIQMKGNEKDYEIDARRMGRGWKFDVAPAKIKSGAMKILKNMGMFSIKVTDMPKSTAAYVSADRKGKDKAERYYDRDAIVIEFTAGNVLRESLMNAKELIASKLNEGSIPAEIADFVMRGTPTPHDLVVRFNIELHHAAQIVQQAAYAFGPGGKGFNWLIKQVEKILRSKALKGKSFQKAWYPENVTEANGDWGKLGGPGSSGGQYWGRRAKDSKPVKMNDADAKSVIKRAASKEAPEDWLLVWWVPPEYVKANEAKFRIEKGWLKPIWDWGKGPVAGGISKQEGVAMNAKELIAATINEQSPEKGKKVTVYSKGGMSASLGKVEGYLVGIAGNALHFVQKKGKKVTTFPSYYFPFWMVVNGWNNPDPDSPWKDVKKSGEVTTARSKYMSVDPRWISDFLEGPGKNLKPLAMYQNKKLQVFDKSIPMLNADEFGNKFEDAIKETPMNAKELIDIMLENNIEEASGYNWKNVNPMNHSQFVKWFNNVGAPIFVSRVLTALNLTMDDPDFSEKAMKETRSMLKFLENFYVSAMWEYIQHRKRELGMD